MRSPQKYKYNLFFQIHRVRGFSLALLGLFLISSTLLLVPFSAHAATGINKQISFQGKVVNANGTNVANGNYDFVFKIYTVSSGGSPVWTETRTGGNQVTVADGIFQVNLGSVTSLPGSVDFNTDNIYLGIEFNGDGEMSPRVHFTAAPYALNADKVHGLTVTDTTGTFTIANSKTLTVNNTLTLSGTDSTAFTFPSTGGGTVITTGNISDITGLTDSQISDTLTASVLTANYVASIANGSGISGGGAGSNAAALTLSLGALTADWNQTGAFNITLNNSSAGIKILENGTSPSLYGIFDVADLSASDKTYTFPNASGTVVTTGNLTDITGTGTLGSLTVSGAIAANGGITFDNTTDTLGAFTAAGTIDMNTNILVNIGNTGTDFVASTGALTLAGVLTANSGISLAGSQSFTASALSYMDLGAITQSSTANQGLRLPNAASATPSNPTSGEGYLAWDSAGNQLITYNGSAWTTVGGGGYNLVKDETTSLTARTTLAFLGAGVSCADSGSQTECTISGGAGSDLQGTYDTDANGSNATISLTAADDGLVFTNPTSGGTDGSTFLLQLNQQNTTANVSSLDIIQASNNANGVNLTANSIDGETGLAITTNGLTSGKGLYVTSSGTSNSVSGNVAKFEFTGSNSGNTGDVVNITNSGSSNANVALAVAQNGSGSALKINNSGTGNLAQFQTGGIDKVVFANNGALTINGSDSSIVRNTTAEFATGTVGSNLTNSNNRIQMSDGTPGNSGQGTITTGSQPATPSNIGAGSFSIARADGKVAIINGGATGTTQLYDPLAGTITAGQTITCNGTTTVGIGSIALPRPNGSYTIVCGVSGSTTTATSTFDPMGTFGSRIGPALNTAVTGAGTVAYKRPNGKYLVTIGASTPGSATNIYDPIANTFAAGPAASSGTWTTGALALPMPDGRALIVNGGSTSTTNIYNPNGVSATIGTFTTGPSLDGVKTAGTCGINGSGSVALKRQDGKYVILSKASVEAVFDPSAMTMTCTSSVSNVSALGDGAHAIPLQNGKFLIFAGGGTTTAFVYNQDTDTFSTYSGTAPTTITTGAHSVLRPDGKWQIITGTNTCTNGCTNVFDTGLPMSDPFPATLTVGAPSAGGSCTAGLHSYFVSFVTSGTESELSNKSSVISCSGSNGTVGLSAIPVGPPGTTSRKVYRTTAGDASMPKLLTTIADNTTTTYSDTTADGSLGADYSVTAATTWYTSEDISNNYIGVASTLRWTAQLEAVYSGVKNGVVNTAYKAVQFYVKTAINSSGCTTPLAAAPWQEIQNSGDSIRAIAGANCVKIAVHFNRPLPKKLYDDRGTWTGNGSTILRLDYVTPTLFGISIDNSAVMKRTAWDFTTPDANSTMATTVPTAPTSSAPSGTSGACTNGNHFWFVTFVINGVESQLSAASTVQNCTGGNQTETLTIPTGPSGTTARKIYRTAAGFLVTDTPFLVGTQSDNSTTSYADGLADSSLGAAFSQMTPSGPITTRAEGSRVETSNNQLYLPWGRITPTTLSTSAAGVGQVYMGTFGQEVPNLNNPASAGTMVIARDDKTFLIIEGGGATADLYDPATNTMTNQSATGDKPTATVGIGGHAIRRPNGKYLIILGNNTTTTNIYDQYAPPGARFTTGPTLTGTAINQGAFSMQNADGTWTIVPGNAATTTSIYDPVRNTMTVGPLQTTGTNFGGLAIPLRGSANTNIYKVIVGTTVGGAGATTTMNYNGNTKVFTAGQALSAVTGVGTFAFQRQDGWWVLVKGESAANTLAALNSLINPESGAETVSSTNISTASFAGRGSHVIPRADGTFLVIGGNNLAAATNGTGLNIFTNIYFPWGGAFNTAAGTNEGKWAAGPNMVLQGQTTAAIAAPTTSAPASGGSNLCDTGTHLWRYSYVTNGVESALSTAGTVQTCTVTTAGQEALTAISVGPTGTTARKVYRTKAGTTAPYFLVTTIADNTTTTYNDSASDASLGATYWSGGVGDGAVSFQRPDGKFLTVYGAAVHTSLATANIGSTMVSLYDAGWYPDGQYLSEEMNVPAMAANSTLEWQQTSDQFVRMAVRTAVSETALRVASFKSISSPGGSIENAANDTWAQVQINFRRDFPTFGYAQNGVYLSSGVGLACSLRSISVPTVNSYQITNGMDLMALQNNGLNVFRVTSNGSILSSSTGGFYSGGADLAENYTSTQALEKGEVVMIDPTNPQAVLRATGQYQSTMLGVVSTAPGFIAGGYTEDSYPIGLVGRVPVRVSTENGPIRAGDFLTSASIPGYAMRATRAGRVLGKALEDFKPGDDATCPAMGLGNLLETKCGSVMLFVNLTDYYGTPLEVVMAEQKAMTGGPVDGLDTTGVTDDTSDGMESENSIRLAVSPPTKEEAMLAFLTKMRDERSANLAPQSEVFTDRVSATDEVIAPTMVTDTLFAKHIKAESIEGLQIFTDQISSLSEKYAGLQADLSAAGTGSTMPATDEVMKALTIESAKVTLALQVLGKLSADGGIVIGGDAEFDGNTIFNKLATFVSETLFKEKVVFEKAPTFGVDTAGFAVIEKGAKSVRVSFDEPYVKQPIVTASLTNDKSPLLDGKEDDSVKLDVALVEQDFQNNVFEGDVRFLVTEKGVDGFTIVLNREAPYNLQFSWVAIAVDHTKTFTSDPVKSADTTNNPLTTPPIVPSTPMPVPSTVPVVSNTTIDTPTPTATTPDILPLSHEDSTSEVQSTVSPLTDVHSLGTNTVNSQATID